MAKFDELDQYYDPGLTVTVLGVEYSIPPASAELGLWCRRLASLTGEVDEDSTGEELQQAGRQASEKAGELPPPPGSEGKSFEELMLGKAVIDEMKTNNVPDPFLQFVAQTAFIRIVGGDRAAERYWKTGGRPQSVGPANRAARRAAAKTGSGSKTTSTGAGATTRARASGSGTRSPSRSGGSATAKPSRGSRS